MALVLALTLKSDTTFGRGDGVAGLVDTEVEHDPSTGLPRVHGRTLKGLLVEESANLLFAAQRAKCRGDARLTEAAAFLFGSSGSGVSGAGALHVGPAELPGGLGTAVQAEIDEGRLMPAQVLESLTSIRRQTAVDPRTGAPATATLRAERVILRETTFLARLDFLLPPDEMALAVLAGCTLGLRRVGLGRNRGRGRVQARLLEDGQDVTWRYLDPLHALLLEATA